ncbi:MAG TPA: bifunctional aspartate kinase/homoserine dehydrogenase I, partial [Bacteroidia bacterium]
MKNAIGISGMLFGSLGRSGVNISAIAQGSSELNISAVIKKTDLKKALNAAHDALFLSSYKTLHLFIAGTGNIGSELLRQIYSSSKWLKENRHLLLKVVGITNRRNMLFDGEEGITLDNWQQDLINKGETADFKRYMEQMFALNLPNSIFVDNTSGSSVSDHYEEIFRHHISVVTCNKSANSSSLEKYNSLKHLAKINKACFNYETNVGAGLPVINTLQNFILSGDEVIRIEAVLSGTFSYVLNNYSGEKTFSEVIRKAQELGYTEPDPRDDLNGEDFRRKTLILAREMGRALEKENIRVEQILPDSCIRANSIPEFYNELSRCESKFSELKMKAKKENKRIRYIATIDHQSAGIEMKLVDSSHPFYDLSGSDNIISFTTNRYQTNPLVVKGPGAGAAVTAAGVFSDIVKVAS